MNICSSSKLIVNIWLTRTRKHARLDEVSQVLGRVERVVIVLEKKKNNNNILM